MNKSVLRIATRKSPLALWQANFIGAALKKHWPHLTITLLPLVTSGDRFTQDKLQTLGGKGLFVKELEEALLDHRADLAVHSMKDVPAELPKNLCLSAIYQRDNPLDALVSRQHVRLKMLPPQSIVGTSSLRRQAQLLSLRPDLVIKTLRGNVNTRLKKLQDGEYDALILAASGLMRLGLTGEISEILEAHDLLPACGQGALGIECRQDDDELHHLLAPLNDPLSAICVNAERKVNARLGGNCHVPLAVYCRPIKPDQILLSAKVMTLDGRYCIHDQQTGLITEALQLAETCASHLLLKGAKQLLENSI